MILAGLALLAALWAGLLRLGWQLTALPLTFASQHGALMVSGFLGTVISLERAVALSQSFGRRRAYFLAPLLAGLGALALLLGLPPAFGRSAITLASLGLTLIFVVIYRLQPDTANATMGLGALLWLAGNGLWLLRFDIARRTIRQKRLTRFIAACLLPGYVWLVASGLLWFRFGGLYTAGPIYDAILHSLFLGFVFSMIFGHAPIIIPSVLRVSVPFRPIFYAHLAFLHLSLLLRIGGDLFANLPLRMWGGLLNVVALLLFLRNTISAAAPETNKATE
jgi:hypothetical protein